jgi:NAD(P)-dependent dehydrogenase (short-subunit alcohol dehydrogenase family)
MSEFKDKVVVITGGSGILGKALAAAMVKQQAKVAIIGRNKTKAEAVAMEITDKGGTALAVEADVVNLESLHSAHETINSELGPCDILVNGAGGNHPGGTTTKSFFFEEDLANKDVKTFFDLDTEGLKYVFDLNFLGTLLPTQVFAKDMIGRKGCSVINISSTTAGTPLTKVPAYSGAKAAISNFTQWMAVHFAKTGIRVNAIAPGFFLTEQNRSLLTTEDGQLTERGQSIIAHTPLGRLGEPDDLTGTLLWLCSESSSFITGIVVNVDGGFNAYTGV